MSWPANDHAPGDQEAIRASAREASDELEVVLARHRSPRRRATQVALIAATLLLGVGVTLRSGVPTGSQGPEVAASPTPLPLLALVRSTVVYGHVLVNGRTYGSPPVTVTLLPGDNEVVLVAPPFVSTTCHVLVNRLPRGNITMCAMSTEKIAGGPPRNVIWIPLAAGRLPQDEHVAAGRQGTALPAPPRDRSQARRG